MSQFIIVGERREDGQRYINGEEETLEDAKQWIDDDKNFNPSVIKYDIYEKAED